MGVLRREIEYRLGQMGFDVRDITLYLPLLVVWSAIEEIDTLITEIQEEAELEAEAGADATAAVAG